MNPKRSLKLLSRWLSVITLAHLTLSPVVADVGELAAPPKSEKKIENTLTKADQDILDYEQNKGPALPLHTLEGTGGILITPTAYLSNPGQKDAIFGRPAASVTYVGAGQKAIQTFAATETLIQRVELGFSVSRFDTGSLRDQVRAVTGLDTGRDDVYLFNLNARGLLIEENSFDVPVPAITAGVSFKANDGIKQMDNNLGGALTSIGLDDDKGVDFTLTASKTFAKVFDRPLLVSAGFRLSKASQLGYVGFGKNYQPTFEANIAYSITPWLWLAGEYRQKENPYGLGLNSVAGASLVRPEDDWWTVGIGLLPSRHTSLTLGYGYFGDVLNTREDLGWAAQFKYEL